MTKVRVRFEDHTWEGVRQATFQLSDTRRLRHFWKRRPADAYATVTASVQQYHSMECGGCRARAGLENPSDIMLLTKGCEKAYIKV